MEFRPEGGEITKDWKISLYEELHNFYCSGDKIKKNKLGGSCSVPDAIDKYIQNFGSKNVEKNDLSDLGTNNIILKRILDK
jgi:hypothetical protein